VGHSVLDIPGLSASRQRDGSVRFISDFRELNKRIKRKPFPIPKIQDMLLKLEGGFQHTTSLDLNMGYYHIKLSRHSKRLYVPLYSMVFLPFLPPPKLLLPLLEDILLSQWLSWDHICIGGTSLGTLTMGRVACIGSRGLQQAHRSQVDDRKKSFKIGRSSVGSYTDSVLRLPFNFHARWSQIGFFTE
jgi:hypothetical protein